MFLHFGRHLPDSLFGVVNDHIFNVMSLLQTNISYVHNEVMLKAFCTLSKSVFIHSLKWDKKVQLQLEA